MQKLIAIGNVIAWSGFWAFGHLALTSDTTNTSQVTVAVILAALGGGLGILAYFWLVRHSENTGYAKRPNRAVPEHLRDPQEEGTA